MQLDTVIFDMDGLLVDSEPLWSEAANEVFRMYGVKLSGEQYAATTGLRTKEFVEWWFKKYNIDEAEHRSAEEKITALVIEKIKHRGAIMPGVHHIFRFFYERHFKIGVASSSPQTLIDVVLDVCGVRKAVQATASAEELLFGKPHPEVFLNCANMLGSKPWNCLCFEDSFNGMIAAKAARMKCVVVPHFSQQKDERWGAADLKISSLQNFGVLHLNLLS